MDETLMEIREFTDPGYSPLVDFGTWRVAMLNYIDEIHPDQIHSMERHNETDEVFVLFKGQGILFLGEGRAEVDKVHARVLEAGKVYNVKKGVWHCVVLSRTGSVLIVENRDTTKENSTYVSLNSSQKSQIRATAIKEQPGEWS